MIMYALSAVLLFIASPYLELLLASAARSRCQMTTLDKLDLIMQREVLNSLQLCAAAENAATAKISVKIAWSNGPG